MVRMFSTWQRPTKTRQWWSICSTLESTSRFWQNISCQNNPKLESIICHLAVWHLKFFAMPMISWLIWSLLQEPCFGNFFCTTDQQPSRFQKLINNQAGFKITFQNLICIWIMKRRAGFKNICQKLPILISIWILKCRTDILTQERVVIRTTTNYVVSCILYIGCSILYSLQTCGYGWCEHIITHLFMITTRQRKHSIGANTLFTLLPVLARRRATGLYWQGFYHPFFWALFCDTFSYIILWHLSTLLGTLFWGLGA